MKYISNFSGGLCSFWAAHRVVQQYGPLNVVLLFADTLIESPQLYEFNQRASDLLGVPITRVSREMTPWQLFRKEGLIGNDRFPICSIRLKREPLNEWMLDNFELTSQGNFVVDRGTVVLGFDWTEAHRVQAMKDEHPSWRIIAPMTEEPIWDKCKMQREAVRLGLPISDNYKWGLPHDNCGGVCVRAGQAHFARVWEVNLPKYMEWENEELDAAADLWSRGIAAMSILKEKVKGVTQSLFLRDFRLRLEAGKKFDRHDWGGCGCGGSTEPSPPSP